MTISDLLGYGLMTLMLGGLLWGSIDLLARIHKQPHQPLNILRMSPYPLVPDEESPAEPREGRSTGGTGGLRLSPVPVETRNQTLR